jgi:hypothetical protein
MPSENNATCPFQLSRSLLWCICLLLPLSVFNQGLRQIFDNYSLYEEEQPVNLDEQLEHFQNLLEHPIDLNKASDSDLEESALFNQEQLKALIIHREELGPLISLYELQAIPHFDLDFIQVTLPYLTLNKSIDDYHLKLSKLITQGEYQLFLRYSQSFPSKSGFDTKAYVGNPSDIYLRYKYNYSNKFYYGITMEKDAGEAMFKQDSKQGFDFYSYHLFWRMNTKVKALAFGDYHVNLGQGLLMWTGFGFNKGSNIATLKKESSPLKPFTSINESMFLRGAGIHTQFKVFQFTAFVSHKSLDANIAYTDSTLSDLDRNSIQLSGYHRTESELANKHALVESILGFNIQFKKSDKHLGFNNVFLNYNEVLKNSNKAYNQYYFQGKQLLNSSLDYHFLHKSFHFFGETALSISKNQVGAAALNGILFNPDKKIDMALLHRYYSPKYQNNSYANAFGESTQVNNEHGLFISIMLKPSKDLSIASYLDYYRFPWLNYQTNQASNGHDLMSILTFKHKKIFESSISYKREIKDSNTKIALGINESFFINNQSRKYLDAYFTNIDLSKTQSLQVSTKLSQQEIEAATFITPVLQQKLRWHISYKPNKSWTFQSRIELSFFNDRINPKQTGVVFYQDIKFNKMELPISFSARIALFDVPQYQSRIYAYENDVLNSFSIPALYNAGLRYYLNLHYKINKHLDAWLRFAHTYYSDVSSKGSGNDEVNQNRIYDLKMQIRLKF